LIIASFSAFNKAIALPPSCSQLQTQLAIIAHFHQQRKLACGGTLGVQFRLGANIICESTSAVRYDQPDALLEAQNLTSVLVFHSETRVRSDLVSASYTSGLFRICSQCEVRPNLDN